MHFSPLVDRIAGRGSAAWSIHAEARHRQEQGEDIIFLTVGDPDQEPPELAIEATVAALRAHRTGYAAIVGYPALREAIASRVARRSGRPCTADNVAVVPGAQGGVYSVIQCLAGPGDEVLVGEPIYATYEGVIGASGAQMVTFPLRPERGFRPDLEALARAITPKTRVIWINSPHNPTGAVFTRAEVERIAALCREHDLWLVSDEVYEDLAFARPHTGAWSLPGMAERTAIVSSLSKSHALPAFRLGWVVGPPELIRHLANLLLSMTYGSPAFIQDGALAALRHELPEVAALHEDYRRRAAILSELLTKAPGCRSIPPEGGMFVLLDVRGTGLSAMEFARRLLDSERVAILPCDGFGPSAAGHLRIALSAPDERLRDAANRILRFTRGLNQRALHAATA
ncbi:MAG: pyridoxal phosphate-dependent aminotransferase [Alphaproteobacteria bacterium]|nr:pyridoxal phosphate-dependent aminotransferase [Alphaproteobacteria bacterium]MBV9966654.1 pyridoxal phosphate-dependent aminotransferase [Alphaproteobacteria bacterium]